MTARGARWRVSDEIDPALLGHYDLTVIPEPRQCAQAIVILGVGSDGTLGILDPASPFTVQPIALTQEAFVAQWAGELLMVADGA